MLSTPVASSTTLESAVNSQEFPTWSIGMTRRELAEPEDRARARLAPTRRCAVGMLGRLEPASY
jgi:hypothetical protein